MLEVMGGGEQGPYGTSLPRRELGCRKPNIMIKITVDINVNMLPVIHNDDDNSSCTLRIHVPDKWCSWFILSYGKKPIRLVPPSPFYKVFRDLGSFYPAAPLCLAHSFHLIVQTGCSSSSRLISIQARRKEEEAKRNTPLPFKDLPGSSAGHICLYTVVQV